MWVTPPPAPPTAGPPRRRHITEGKNEAQGGHGTSERTWFPDPGPSAGCWGSSASAGACPSPACSLSCLSPGLEHWASRGHCRPPSSTPFTLRTCYSGACWDTAHEEPRPFAQRPAEGRPGSVPPLGLHVGMDSITDSSAWRSVPHGPSDSVDWDRARTPRCTRPIL